MSGTGMMEQWQLQQRALKEKERLQKMETSEMHKQFRGTVTEEELKLRAIKEEERLKKQQTAEMHKQFRGGVREDDLKLSALRQEERLRKQEAIENHHGYRLSAEDIEKRERKQREDQFPSPVKVDHSDQRELIEEGAVNRLKGNYNSPSPTNIKGTGSPSASSRHLLSDRNIDSDPSSPRKDARIEFGSLQAAISSFDSVYTSGTESDDEKKSEAVSSSSPFPDPSSTEKAAMYFDADVVEPKALYPESVPDGAAPNENLTSQALASPADAEIKDQDDSTLAGDFKTLSDPLSDMAVASDQATAAKEDDLIVEQSSRVRQDVSFSFGVITIADKPDLEGYMQAVEQEVKALLVQNSDLSENVMYEQQYPPFVKDIHLDENYSSGKEKGVKRYVVTAAVPIFLSHEEACAVSREAVINCLQESVQSGRFLSLALPKECL